MTVSDYDEVLLDATSDPVVARAFEAVQRGVRSPFQVPTVPRCAAIYIDEEDSAVDVTPIAYRYFVVRYAANRTTPVLFPWEVSLEEWTATLQTIRQARAEVAFQTWISLPLRVRVWRTLKSQLRRLWNAWRWRGWE